MGYLTPSAVERVLKHLVGDTSLPAISTYLGLFTTSPTENYAGVELSSGGYVRKPITPSQWTYDSVGQTIKNNVAISFDMALTNWGQITAVGVFTAATGGTLLWYGYLAVPTSIVTGQTLTIQANTVSLEYANSPLINESFHADVASSYTFLQSPPSSITVDKEYDLGFGYKEAGSLRISITRNVSSSALQLVLLRSGNIPVVAEKNYTVVLSAQTSNAKITPRVRATPLTALQESIVNIDEPEGAVIADKWETHSVSFSADANAKFVRVSILLDVTEAEQTGTVWLDNIRVIPVD